MTCDVCPLALLCLAGTLRLSYCAFCQKVLITLPPRVRRKGSYVQLSPGVITDVSLPRLVIDYTFAECDDLDQLPTLRRRTSGCPQCEPDNIHYREYQPLGPGHGGVR